ncbi:MAG TPA: 50S ribosomal protein L10 [Anaerolineales bacterium]|nr:50S ribosomal protein L10 [Anaerolineales bacterium]
MSCRGGDFPTSLWISLYPYGEVKTYFFRKGGIRSLAISKQQKKEVIAQYADWLKNSGAVVVTEYTGLTMKDMDELRGKVRESGGEFHVVKNTLVKLALQKAGIDFDESQFVGSTAMAFAFEDAPATAKAIADFAKESPFVNIKGGFLENQMVSAADIKALASLPPLPVMRATLLAAIMAPATQLVRTLAEPGRQVAAVVKAYAEKDAAPEAA